jgi:GT2 family glycosyltransferase
VAAEPDNLDARLCRARMLEERGHKDEAIGAYADILRQDPHHQGAYAAIVHAGARARLPDNFHRRTHVDGFQAVMAKIGDTREAIATWVEMSTYPLTCYDAFRQDFQITPPPAHPKPAAPVHIIVHACETAPFFLRSTLLSLHEQSEENWRATVIATEALRAHPVASLANIDPRIDMAPIEAAIEVSEGYCLHLSAGTVLHPLALQWFAFAVARTGALAAWSDHDHAVEHWRTVLQYETPQFWGVFDLDLLAQTRFPPAAVMVHHSLWPNLADGCEDAAEQRRTLLLRASAMGSPVHIPHILASVLRIPERAEAAPPADDFAGRWSTDPAGSPPRAGAVPGTTILIEERVNRPSVGISAVRDADERLQIIIPTRDEAALLAIAVESLMAKCRVRSRVEMVIVDNRSTSRETFATLDMLKSRWGVQIMTLDEPFNWSRANNLAAQLSTAENIVFANNDVEMLTNDWDDLLLGYLQRPDIGAVGTRLLYPDTGVQHAGVLFGLGEGSPIHDGLRAGTSDPGPLDRFDIVHAVAAVTGAFMGVPRELFVRIGGFDERGLAISYNDVDLCLQIRAEALNILYAPTIELIHHESKTRGLNDNRAKVAWDQGELKTIHARWGASLTEDPGYNPHWSRSRPFDGYRAPTTHQVLTHIDASARPHPWQVTRRSENSSS